MTWKIALLDADAHPIQTFDVPLDRPLVIGRGTASDTQIKDPRCRVSTVVCFWKLAG